MRKNNCTPGCRLVRNSCIARTRLAPEMDNQIDPKSALATKFALTPCMDPPSPPALPLAHCKHPSLQAAPRTPRFPGASQAAEATPPGHPRTPPGNSPKGHPRTPARDPAHGLPEFLPGFVFSRELPYEKKIRQNFRKNLN